MTFVSLEFLVFIIVGILGRLLLDSTKTETAYFVFLILASMVFYAWHVPWYLLLMIFTAVLHYAVGEKIAVLKSDSAARKHLFVTAIVISLGLLGLFKYLDFSIDILNQVLARFGVVGQVHPLGIVLPIGISFYTFHALSYTIDIYRGRTQPARNLWDFFLYIAFFPQLVAGPIVRATEFLYQIPRRRSLSLKVTTAGGYLVIRGLFLKMVVADNIAPVVDKFWPQATTQSPNGIVCIALAALFSAQIFADFAGYTDIARGLAYILGYRLPLNFNYPYIASSFADFWRRWHISLSRWLRDYLYIPLGGNRGSEVRTYFNLLTVMLLGGLWHGAAYTFLVWGAIHGLALAIERALGLNRLQRKAPRVAWWLAVQVIVIVAWVFFRASSFQEASQMLATVVSGQYSLTIPPELTGALVFIVPVLAMHARALLAEQHIVHPPGIKESSVWAAVMCYAVFTWYGRTFNPFIYFQF
jgi:alginate O-acetyltransferase complex protein AlgI